MAVIVFLCVLFLAASSPAQTGSAIFVRVTSDEQTIPSGGTAVLWPAGITQSLDASGSASFDELTCGRYRLEVSADRCVSRDTVFDLAAGEQVQLLLTLNRLAAVLPEVTVEGQALSAPVRILNRRNIEMSCARDLAGFLHTEVGLDVRSDGTLGSPVTATIGGSQPGQVLVRVDGRRIQDAGSGEADLSSVPLEWVESVAVYRGGQTELGGEAIGGVIDVTTRRPQSTATYSAAAETHTTYGRMSFFGSGQTGPFASLLSFARSDGPGDFKYRISEDDGTGSFTPDLGQTYHRINNDITRDQLLVKMQTKSSTAGYIEITGLADRQARGMPGYLAPQLTPLARQSSQQEAIAMRAVRHFSPVTIRGNGGYDRSWREYTNDDSYGRVQRTEERSERWSGEISTLIELPRTEVQGGASAGHDRLEGTQIAGGTAVRASGALWCKTDLRLFGTKGKSSSLMLESGMRWEAFGEDHVLLPRVGLTAEYRPSYRVAGFASRGRSYRAPSLYSLFWLDDMASRGNPDLEAETSDEWVGRFTFETAMSNVTRFEASASEQRVRDLIVWRRTFDNYWKPFNLNRAHIQTLDLLFEQSLFHGSIRLSTGVNWMEARDDTDDRNTGGKYLTYRAPRSHRASFVFDHSGIRIAATYRWVAGRPILETNSKWLSEYDVMDLQSSYSFRAGSVELQLMVGCENALDSNYRIVRHAPMPLRQWYGGIRVTAL